MNEFPKEIKFNADDYTIEIINEVWQKLKILELGMFKN
jgi:hypothetical protein